MGSIKGCGLVLGGWDVDKQESEENDTSRKKKWMVRKEEAIVNEDVGNGIVSVLSWCLPL